MVRQAHFIDVVGAFLIAFVIVGCGGSGGTENIDERDGERGAAATKEETTAPAEGGRSKAQSAQKPVIAIRWAARYAWIFTSSSPTG